jgi:hypothetical protein
LAVLVGAELNAEVERQTVTACDQFNALETAENVD